MASLPTAFSQGPRHRRPQDGSPERPTRAWTRLRRAARSPLSSGSALSPMGTGAWVVTVGLLVATLAFTLHAQRRAEAARRAWGDTATVWVAVRSVPAATTLRIADVKARVFPRALVPEGAVPATVDSQAANTGTLDGGPVRGDTTDQATADGEGVVGRVALVALGVGDVLVEDRLGPAGSVPLERWLGPDTVALPVPTSLLPWAPTSFAWDGPVALIHRNGLVNGQILRDPDRTTSATANQDRTGTESDTDGTVLVVVSRQEAPTLVAALLDGQLVVALISAPLRSTG